MGWECPQCSRCYAPTVDSCPTCPGITVDPDVIEELHKVSLSGGGTGDNTNTTLTSTHWNACFSYVKNGTSKYCANCGSHEKEHNK